MGAIARAAAVVATFTLLGSVAHARPWVQYKSDKYGFSMLVPKGTRFVDKEWKKGWAGVRANYWGVRLYGITHKGKQHTPGQIELFGVLVTGVPFKRWKVIDKGKNKRGWNWYKVARATDGKRVALAGYGTGKKGSYLLVLVTTVKSFRRHRAAYRKWARSVTLF